MGYFAVNTGGDAGMKRVLPPQLFGNSSQELASNENRRPGLDEEKDITRHTVHPDFLHQIQMSRNAVFEILG